MIVNILVTVLILITVLPLNIHAKKSNKLKQKAIAETESLKPLIDEISSTLWTYSEIALKEKKSSQLLVEKLKAAGFTVEEGVAGLSTAFVGTYGSGSPVIGILAEFDALPGVGNEPVPQRKKRSDGVTSGHGCGHNLFGAGSVGGAIALKNIMEKNGIKGTVKLFGCPAEETVVGKVIMAKEGVFNDLDAVMDWHPGHRSGVSNDAGRALNNFEVEFFGQAAHGAFDPWNGRSALDAVELMNHGVNMMREHIKPSARIHYVIPNAGDVPNVVPEYAKVWYFVREFNRKDVNKYYKRILNIAKGAAIATETTHKVTLITGVHEYFLNRPIQEALQTNLELVGAPVFSEEEHAFAKELQKNTGKEELGYYDKVKPLPAELEEPSGGSTDAAEVSWIVPTAAFSVATAADKVPWHSWATTACHGTAAARKGALVAAKVFATTGIDLLTNPKLIKKAKQFYDKTAKGRTYVSPLDE
ncbi:MAG: amidohydrolase [bacterium]|nr:amidohydrolase [bacterium]